MKMILYILVLLAVSLPENGNAATVTVGPNDSATVKRAQCHTGDTLKFLDGSSADASLNATGILLQIADGASVQVIGSAIVGTGLTPTQLQNGILFCGAGSKPKISGCKFSNVAGAGIYGYPATASITLCTFDLVVEPLHFSSLCVGLTISTNQVTRATRIGFELQQGMQNVLIDSNYIGNWLPQTPTNSHMAVSCATGGAQTAPFAGQGQNIEISNNVFSDDGQGQPVSPGINFCAVEAMGQNFKLTSNVFWNWGFAILNGAIGPISSSGNTIYGGQFVATDAVLWPIARVNGTNQPGPGDVLLSLSAMPLPPQPGTPIPPVNPTPAPQDLAGSNTQTAAVISWSAVPRTTYHLVRTTTGNGAVSDFGTIIPPYSDTQVNPSWVYSYACTASVGGVASAPAVLPWQFVPASHPPAVLTVKTLVTTTSDDAGKSWTATSAVQP